MQSEQERLVLAFSKLRFGAPFVFKPDLVPDRQRRREPLDLAMASNECVLLMEMQRRETASAETMINHNLSHLKGFVRRWQAGTRLVGSNDHRSFDLGIDSARQVVLLSIVEGKHAVARYHGDLVTEMRDRGLPVAMAATVPYELLGRVGVEATLLDLVHLLKRLRDEGGFTGEQFGQVADFFHHQAVREAAIDAMAYAPPHMLPVPALTNSAMAQMLLDLRTDASMDEAEADAILQRLNDLDWQQTNFLMARLAYACEAVRVGPERAKEFDLRLGPYLWMIAVQVSTPLQIADTFRAANRWRTQNDPDAQYPPACLVVGLDSPALIAAHPRRGPSQVEIFLDEHGGY